MTPGTRVEERLQKILAAAGVASRRSAETLIRAGRVRVNGALTTRLGSTADPDRDTITVDDRPVQPVREFTYVLLHKPVGVVSTTRDPQGRPTVLDLLASSGSAAEEIGQRLYPVGRLDRDSSGLVLLTDDGELTLRLTHPRYHLEKEYLVEVAGEPTPGTLARFASGIPLDGRLTAPAAIRREPSDGETTWLRIILREGRQRQIRRMLEALGHPVVQLIRIRVGPLELGRLPEGHGRRLQSGEIARLRRAVGLKPRQGEHADRN